MRRLVRGHLDRVGDIDAEDAPLATIRYAGNKKVCSTRALQLDCLPYGGWCWTARRENVHYRSGAPARSTDAT